jgi:hypothetical protein
MRIAGIVLFGGMILLYDAGGQLLGAWNKTTNVREGSLTHFPGHLI